MKTKMQLSRQIFSILLCLALMLTYVPMTVLAAEDEIPITNPTVSFDSNGGAEFEPITVSVGEEYGRLPSSSIVGLSGGDSNWYLVDENGIVTETKITGNTHVEVERDHKLFVKRKVLSPTLKITLEVPGAISDNYQYYVPGNSQRILTVTVNNQNTDILDYTYQWYKDGTAIEGATAAKLTLDGNVSDTGTYTVKVTVTLKDGTGIVVTENTASAEKEQKVKIMHAANTLYYDANGGEGGPSSNYTGGTTATVAKDEPTREGFIFDGWNTKMDGTGEDYIGGATYTFENDNGNGGCDVTLYAQWIKAYGVYVGGVQVIETNRDDVFGDGKVSYDAATNTLTLNNYSYEGDGYQYGYSEDGEETYSAAIYSEGSINIKLVGNNTVKNTFTDFSKNQYGDAVVTEGRATFTGEGTLNLHGAYAIESDDYVIVDGCTLELDAIEDGIVADNIIIKNGAYVMILAEFDGIAADGETIIENANVRVVTERDGIYADGNITITDSEVYVEAEVDGVYSFDGKVIIESTKITVSDYGSWLDGTKVTVKAGGNYGIFAYKGLTIDDKLTISTPIGGSIDDTNSTVVQEGAVVKEIVIEPLGYTVTISGLQNDMAALVPAGQSLNEAYCEMYGVKDFSEIFDTEKEGCIFGGWYTDEACTDGKEFDFNDSVNADITIYAKWVPVYVATVEKTEGGDVTVSHESVIKGETVVITPKPDDGKEVDTVTVTDKDGKLVTVTPNDDGTYSFIQPESDVTVKVTYKDKQTGTTVDDVEKDDNKPTDFPQTGTAVDDVEKDDNKPTGIPQTGDNSNIALWFALLFVSGGAFFAIPFTAKEKKRRKLNNF